MRVDRGERVLGLDHVEFDQGGVKPVRARSRLVSVAGSRVVVVTIDCRVGAEGFAFLDDVPPNRGFLDQIAAAR
ncbi:hypothetical protein [Streptomyces globisporus]